MTSASYLGTAAPALSRRRIGSAAGVIAIHALIGYAFLTGLAGRVVVQAQDGLKLFDVLPDPPPPPAIRPRATQPKAPHREGAASPRNIRSKATEVVAPTVPIPVPPPLIATPTPATGSDASTGASTVRGPGTGSGGQGSGTGSGAVGDGDGGGTPLRWRSGRIKDSDFPRAALDMEPGSYTVYLRFTVGIAGRVTDCTVTKSSGNAALDDTTCRLILQRFRYTPTTDAAGRKVPDVVTGEHEWTVYPPENPHRN